MSSTALRALLLAGLSALPLAAAAQTPAAPAAPAPAAPTGAAQVFTPADFARFAPQTAFDMLAQVPGFTIRSTDGGRGLGQATENVLIGGQRIANKSGGALDELRRTSAARVERIEVLDAARLGIAGLSGQVANVILKAEQKGHGQFAWRPQVRPHYAWPRLLGGSISYGQKLGAFDTRISLSNDDGGGAYGGPAIITGPADEFVERRDQIVRTRANFPRLALTSKIDGPGSSEGNVTLAYTPYSVFTLLTERRTRADGADRDRRFEQRQKGGSVFDANVDASFALGPGRLKLIGLRRFDHEPIDTVQRFTFDNGQPDEGTRFNRLARIGETVARGEYGWKIGGNNFQLSLERADNRLEQIGRLFLLDPAGTFVEQDFPEGSGIVRERRYEGLVTWSRALSSSLDVQLVGGGELSRLERVDGDLPARRFRRPKGSLTLGWRPAAGWDASLKLNRKVGQISFYDFLSQPKVSEERKNSGNPDLVPPQSWEAEVEVGRALGAWGKTRVRAWRHWISDIIDIIPIGEDGEGVGNLPSASRMGIEWTSTLNLDPLGIAGAKLDGTLRLQRSRVRDPLTLRQREIGGSETLAVQLGLRHDIPRTPFAWGYSLSHSKGAPVVYTTEISRSWEGPWFDTLFVEHKSLFGLKVRAEVVNLANARHRLDRQVFAGRRTSAPLLFRQRQNQLIGPIFALSVEGTF